MKVPAHVRTVWHGGVAIVRSGMRHRLNGHAAEISFFALLSLIPVTVTVGAALKLVAATLGDGVAEQGREGALDSIRLLIGPTLDDSVVGPFVNAQLTQQDSGLAIGGLIVAWWLFGRLFTAVGHGLDAAYGVTDRRPSIARRIIALTSSAVGLAGITLTLMVMVVGLHGDQHGIDKWLSKTPVAAAIWNVVRWPLLLLILVAVLVGLYRYSPNVRHRWRDCVPGAVLGVVLWIAAAAVFRAYLMFGSGAPTGVRSNDQQVVLIGRAVGASIGTAVFIYFTTTAVLLGAEVNALLIRHRELRATPAVTGGIPLPAAGPPDAGLPSTPRPFPAAGPAWPPPPAGVLPSTTAPPAPPPPLPVNAPAPPVPAGASVPAPVAAPPLDDAPPVAAPPVAAPPP
jgi:membrane protein